MLKPGNVGEKRTRHNDWRGSTCVGRGFWIASQSDSRRVGFKSHQPAHGVAPTRSYMESKNPSGLAQRKPWLVAFSFGLLHGLGFAGGLSAAGLPAGHIPPALGFFSPGVEGGPFSFVGAWG